jgi:hypothetical protein
LSPHGTFSSNFPNSEIIDTHSGFDHLAEPPRLFSATCPGLRRALRILKLGHNLGVSSTLARLRREAPPEFIKPIFQLLCFGFNPSGQYGAYLLMKSPKLFA